LPPGEILTRATLCHPDKGLPTRPFACVSVVPPLAMPLRPESPSGPCLTNCPSPSLTTVGFLNHRFFLVPGFAFFPSKFVPVCLRKRPFGYFREKGTQAPLFGRRKSRGAPVNQTRSPIFRAFIGRLIAFLLLENWSPRENGPDPAPGPRQTFSNHALFGVETRVFFVPQIGPAGMTNRSLLARPWSFSNSRFMIPLPQASWAWSAE